jgi:hypothetical protein
MLLCNVAWNLLESAVCESTDPSTILYYDEDASVNEEALRGTGSNPSPFYVERLTAENGFEIHRHFDADLNVGDQFVCDWEHRNDGRLAGWRRRRLWYFTHTEEVNGCAG